VHAGVVVADVSGCIGGCRYTVVLWLLLLMLVGLEVDNIYPGVGVADASGCGYTRFCC